MPIQRNVLPSLQRYGRRGPHQRAIVEGPRDQGWPGTWMVLGIFLLLVSFWWAGIRTLTSYSILFRWLALFCFIGNLLPYRVGLRLGMERLEWFLFNLLAVGPVLFSVLLWCNLLGHGPETLRRVQFQGTVRDLREQWMTSGELPEGVAVSEGVLNALPLSHDQRILGTSSGLLGFDVISTWTRPDGWSD